ncbi:short-chain dehydrogenase reductase ATA1 [Impatiens glandulifera]|uniref:short-chain dehydrogenase reductase ATA1 n=1 Tax=Impatiens glandulifera TaxID=253017 RepID=UPI001FB104D2|nr:short-chain dehydrogenase reductase ATA1 [Impatiens glandulifera]
MEQINNRSGDCRVQAQSFVIVIVNIVIACRLKGKVAVITGGARGIGAATAKLFYQHGAHVVIADILDELGSALADSIEGYYLHCDVSNESDVESVVQFAVSWKGRLDIMFNNAGIPGPSGSITNLDTKTTNGVLGVNLNGVVYGIKHAARAMINAGRGGSIICMSSSAALMTGLASHAYTLSKQSIIGIAKSCACELGAHGIRVNCVSPHGVPSEMLVGAYRSVFGNDSLSVDDVRKIVGETGSLLRGRGATMEDVAYAVMFLASGEEAGFITAQNLVVDGGFTSASTQHDAVSLLYRS